jgi:hypothetical protein
MHIAMNLFFEKSRDTAHNRSFRRFQIEHEDIEIGINRGKE